MGLMDNIKKAQDAAQQAMQQGGAGAMSPSAGDAEYANLAMKLNQNGLPGVATISSISVNPRLSRSNRTVPSSEIRQRDLRREWRT